MSLFVNHEVKSLYKYLLWHMLYKDENECNFVLVFDVCVIALPNITLTGLASIPLPKWFIYLAWC